MSFRFARGPFYITKKKEKKKERKKKNAKNTNSSAPREKEKIVIESRFETKSHSLQ